jgi:hypothetical protein
MDTGTGIALAGFSFSIVMLIYRVLPPKSTKAENRAEAWVESEGAKHCQEHSGVCKSIENIEAWVKEIQADVKLILRRES